MEEGKLEILLINAEGIKHRLLTGKPGYYVLIQCGEEIRRSKTTKGYRHEAFWNERFEFELPLLEWKKLTSVNMSIMEQEHFKNEGFIGQSKIELGGIISEAEEKGSIELEPSAYNLVLKDDTYKGQIKVALRFTATKEANGENISNERAKEVAESKQSICEALLRLLNVSSWWTWRFSLFTTAKFDQQ